VRAVLDTNALASGVVGILSPLSAPGQLLRAWRAGEFELAISGNILTELGRVLEKPYFQRRLARTQVARFLALLRRQAIVTSITVQIAGVATHPEDDLILATALSAQADYLVTGDRGLLAVGAYEGVQILSPRGFLALISQQTTT
jgi:putative PIN family toxin of toxin-antitoxin system